MNELTQHIFYRLSTYTVWNDLDSQVKDLLTEAINIGIDETQQQVSVEPEVKVQIAEIDKEAERFSCEQIPELYDGDDLADRWEVRYNYFKNKLKQILNKSNLSA